MPAEVTVAMHVLGMQIKVDLQWPEGVTAEDAARLYKDIEAAILGVVNGPARP